MIKRLWSRKNEKSSVSAQTLKSENIPDHIAIIMDGNGRWAKKKGLPRIAGHHSGMKAVKRITMAANSLGVNI